MPGTSRGAETGRQRRRPGDDRPRRQGPGAGAKLRGIDPEQLAVVTDQHGNVKRSDYFDV